MNQIESKFSVPAFRKLEILNLLRERGVVQISELVEHFGVSQATVRRDLNELHDNGSICRTHGGAVLGQGTTFEQTHSKKLGLMQEEKQRIASYAATLISDNESVFLDSGTTALALSKELTERKNLTVITPNIDIINSISLHASSTLVVVGGILRRDYSVVAGSIAEEFIRGIKVDKTFVGADAIDSKQGLYNSNFTEAGLKKLVVECGRMRILISDSTKFGVSGLVKICPLQQFDFMITDSLLEDEFRTDIENTGVGLVVV